MKSSDFIICGVCGKYYSERIVLKNSQRMKSGKQKCCGKILGMTGAERFTPEDVENIVINPETNLTQEEEDADADEEDIEGKKEETTKPATNATVD